MWQAAVASLRGHRRRALSMGSAVMLGVAFLAGTLILGDTLRAGFGGLFTEANAGTDALVRGADVIQAEEYVDRAPVDATVVDAVAAVPGVVAAAPFIQQRGQIVGAGGQVLGGDGPPTLAGNWIPDDRLNPYTISDGRPPAARGEVVIDRRSAREGDLDVGDTTVVRVPEPVDVTIVGIARFGSRDSMSAVTFAGFTTGEAQRHLQPRPGTVTGVLAAAGPGLAQDDLVERIRPVLPEGVEAITGDAYTAEQQEDIESDFLGFLEAFLLVFAGIALVVATFSIYNTFSVVVAQRTRESALMRAIGASRRQVLGSVIVEGAVIGLLASAVGVVAGIGLSRGLSTLFDVMGFPLPTSELVIRRSSVGVSLAVGLVVTLVAGIAPAVRAARVRPMAALRDVAVDRSAGSRGRVIGGSAVTAAGAVTAATGAAGPGDLALTGAGALLMVVGVVLFGPVVARPVSGLLGVPLRRLRGMTGHLARANAVRNPTRTSGTASALMIGVAVVGAFTVLAASLRTYIDDTVQEAFRGDLVIEAETFGGGTGFSPDMARQIDALPEVETATGLGFAAARVAGEEVLTTTVDGPNLARVWDVGVREGSLAGLDRSTVAVTETFAADHGLSPGSQVPVAFAGGSVHDLTVAAIYEGGELTGDVLLPAALAEEATGRRSSHIVFADLASGVDPGEGRAAVQPVVDRFSGPAVQDGRELAERAAAEIDQILTVVYVLLTLAVIIALMAIATTLSLSIHERTRELGLLRAVGQTRRQLRAMVRGEALIVALFGTVGGLGLGGFLGWALMRALAEDEGVPMAFAVPAGQMAILFALGGLAGLLAAVRPAHRAAKLDVLDAIATE